MGDSVNYWKIGKDHIINRHNMNYVYSYIGKFPMSEIRDKAKELYKQYISDGWEGILLKIVRADAWDRVTNFYYLYYDGKKFIKNTEFIYFDNKDIIDYLESSKHKIKSYII